MTNASSAQTQHYEALLELFEQFSQFSSSEKGGINRLAASATDGQARDFLCDWFKQNGLKVLVDGLGNIFGVLELGIGKSEHTFFCGSHLDSQENAGKYDGTLGVAYACISGLIIRDKVTDGSIEPKFGKLVVCNWTNEEGARFQPSLLGSRVFVGGMDAKKALAIVDGDGTSLRDALKEIGYLGSDNPPKPDHYLEVHIEQGRKLEEAALSIANVRSCWGARKLRVEVRGCASHTGPTPMDERKDALLAASQIILGVKEISLNSDQVLHSSVGRIEVEPNSPNTVADKVTLWLELRAEHIKTLDTAEQSLAEATKTLQENSGCSFTVTEREVRDVVSFDEPSRRIVEDAFENAGIDHLSLSTISGHDAVQLQSICPSTLLFVPSHGGVTHSPEEFTSNNDICAGLDATVAALSALITTPLSGHRAGMSHV